MLPVYCGKGLQRLLTQDPAWLFVQRNSNMYLSVEWQSSWDGAECAQCLSYACFNLQCSVTFLLCLFRFTCFLVEEKNWSWIRGSVLKNVNQYCFVYFFLLWAPNRCYSSEHLLKKNWTDISKQQLLICVMIIYFSSLNDFGFSAMDFTVLFKCSCQTLRIPKPSSLKLFSLMLSLLGC